jgi:hypothetical protein
MDDTPAPRRQSTVIRRGLAWIVDYTIVMVPAGVLVTLALLGLVHGLPAYIGGVAGDVGWSKLAGMISHHAEVGTLRAAASGEWISFALPLLLALLAFPFIQFVYLATMLSWRGRTVGKMLTDVRVADWGGGSAQRVRKSKAFRRAFFGTFAEAGLVSIAFTVMAVGQFQIGLFLWLGAIAVFWLNAFAALGPLHRTIVDRLSGTIVVRQLLYAQMAQQSAAFAQRVAAVGRRTPDAVVAIGEASADAVAIAGQLTREGTEALLQSAPVQQVLDSRAARRAQELGAAGADQARRFGGVAAVQARRVGGRAQELWQARQARRNGPARPELPPGLEQELPSGLESEPPAGLGPELPSAD